MLVKLKQIEIPASSRQVCKEIAFCTSIFCVKDYFEAGNLKNAMACFKKPAKIFYLTITTCESQTNFFVAGLCRDLWVLKLLFAVVFGFLFLSSCWNWCFIYILKSSILSVNTFNVQKLSQLRNYNVSIVNSKCSLIS